MPRWPQERSRGPGHCFGPRLYFRPIHGNWNPACVALGPLPLLPSPKEPEHWRSVVSLCSWYAEIECSVIGAPGTQKGHFLEQKVHGGGWGWEGEDWAPALWTQVWLGWVLGLQGSLGRVTPESKARAGRADPGGRGGYNGGCHHFLTEYPRLNVCPTRSVGVIYHLYLFLNRQIPVGKAAPGLDLALISGNPGSLHSQKLQFQKELPSQPGMERKPRWSWDTRCRAEWQTGRVLKLCGHTGVLGSSEAHRMLTLQSHTPPPRWSEGMGLPHDYQA